MKRRLCLLVGLLGLSYSVWAGPIISGGGDAVVCYTDATKKTIKSVQMFDHWEQEKVLHYKGGIDMGGTTLSVQDKIILVTDRVAKFDPALASKIKVVALSLANNISNYLVTSAQLPEIDDANPKLIPSQPNCYIEQYALQHNKDLVTGQYRYFIADKFYNHPNTSNSDKAGLLLHEAIYRYAILNGATNSDGVRFFNYVISTAKINGLNLFQSGEYLKLINEAQMNYADCAWDNNNRAIVYYESPDDDYARLCYNSQIKLRNNVMATLPALSEVSTWSSSYFSVDKNPPNTTISLDLLIKGNWINVKPRSFSYSSDTERADGLGIHLDPATTPESFVNQNFQMVGPKNIIHPCSGSYVGLGFNNEAGWCNVKNNEFHINGQSLKTNFAVQIVINSLLAYGQPEYSIRNLMQDLTVTVPGTQQNLQITLKKPEVGTESFAGYFDANGDINVAHNFVPVVVNFSGIPVLINNLEIKNGVLSSSMWIPVPDTVKGLKLLTPTKDKEQINDFVVQQCINNGYKNEYGSPRYKLEDVYASGMESFMDLKTNQSVVKTDEYVTVVKSIECYGTRSTNTY